MLQVLDFACHCQAPVFSDDALIYDTITRYYVLVSNSYTLNAPPHGCDVVVRCGSVFGRRSCARDDYVIEWL